MILITGAAGFIGSCMVAYLNEQGKTNLILVDDFSRQDKTHNYRDKAYLELVERSQLWDWLEKSPKKLEAVIHLGARTDTTEKRWDIFEQLNLQYSQKLWNWCVQHNCPLIYASSAATYGGGEWGFSDEPALIPSLAPLNPYGRSKQDFDVWALSQSQRPPWWAGLKFFNVYGPNESHKGRMASVVFHAFRQIQQSGSLRLFRSHRPDIQDGDQSRDFVYVKDVTQVIHFLLQTRPCSGIYNLGTGQARSFRSLAESLFSSLGIPLNIEFIDTPADIRDTYQYFTQAEMGKLMGAGYANGFTSLEQGIDSYVQDYLLPEKIW